MAVSNRPLRVAPGGAVVLAFFAHGALAGPPPFAKFPIDVHTGDNRFARIDGSHVAWTRVAYLGGPTTDNDVFGYDISTGQTLTIANGAGYQDSPAISGDTILWSDWTPKVAGSPDVYGRLFSGGVKFPVTTAATAQSAQEISGNLVVWHDARNGKSTIYGRRLDQPLGSDFPISGTTAYDQQFPDVSGNVVVWMSFLEPGDQGNIYGRDLTSGAVFPICTDPAYQLFPRISGNYVIWEDNRDGHARVYGKNLLTGEEFPVSSGGDFDQTRPAIDGDLVVWMDGRNGAWDLYGRSLSGGPEFPITDTPGLNEGWPDVSGNVVVFEQDAGGSLNDIYGVVVPEPAAITALGFVATGLLCARRSPKSR